jgi:O-antigen/teichoic acid export membrane protein
MISDLAQRSIRSVTWISFVNMIFLPVNFIQSVLLARLLAVEYFGVYAGMSSIIVLTSVIFEFGLGNAYLHRSQETLNQEQAISVLFTLRLIFDTLWLLSFLIFGFLTLSGLNRLVFLVLLVAGYFNRLTLTPRLLLVRQVRHRRLAILDLIINISTTVASLFIAFLSHSIWALLISPITATVFGIMGMYFIKPIWKPKLIYTKSAFRYFMSFGSRNLANNIFDAAIENIDNIWTSIFLGNQWLGYYSRAFKFAIYPRIILSTPISSVVLGTFAELKFDRRRLSKAFFQTNALLIRTGFLLAGWLAVIAPQFIRLLLGERWMPMLEAFRLMLIFSLLDPIKSSVSSVFVSVGVPEKISIIRIAQLSVMIVGLLTLGFRFQIIGVALSVDLMIVVGTVLSLLLVRSYIDVSYLKLFAAPVISLVTGIGLAVLFNSLFYSPRSDLWTAIGGSFFFGGGYVTVLLILEGKQIYLAIHENASRSYGLKKVDDFLRHFIKN